MPKLLWYTCHPNLIGDGARGAYFFRADEVIKYGLTLYNPQELTFSRFDTIE